MADKKRSGVVIYILTPFLVLILCTAIIAVAAIKPYNKLSTYIGIAFMDNLKTIPSNGITAGLHIKDNNIDVDYSAPTTDSGSVVWPEFGEQFAVIRSDSLPSSIPVYWGSSSELFKRGACQSSSSTIPGENGNAVISAHVDTFFADIDKLKVGDKVVINTNYGYFTYEVSELIEFKKDNKKYIIPSDDSRLTLYTCKTDVLGATDMRKGVVCKLTDKKFYTK
ncbi:MAG: class D sortase [Ruminococcus sp.]|jgi:sortase A|nr:class D sortase [Ruminococcus sp.]